MKEWTDITLTITLDGCAEMLASAQSVVVSIDNGTAFMDIEPTVDGDELVVALSPQQTAALVGVCMAEVTIVADDGSVAKSETLGLKIGKAVKGGSDESES